MAVDSYGLTVGGISLGQLYPSYKIGPRANKRLGTKCEHGLQPPTLPSPPAVSAHQQGPECPLERWDGGWIMRPYDLLNTKQWLCHRLLLVLHGRSLPKTAPSILFLLGWPC